MLLTNRQAINSFRKKLQEAGVDSTYTRGDLLAALHEHLPWLIKREADAGKIYRSTALFQTLRREVVELDAVPACLGLRTNCKVYRTKSPLPELWQDSTGPILKDITSVDGTTPFLLTSPGQWAAKKQDPYQRLSREKYVFHDSGYLYFPEHNPHWALVTGLFKRDVRLDPEGCADCGEDDCVRFLDTKLYAPEWVVAEAMAKALQLLLPSKQLPEDQQPDKNPNRKS